MKSSAPTSPRASPPTPVPSAGGMMVPVIAELLCGGNASPRGTESLVLRFAGVMPHPSCSLAERVTFLCGHYVWCSCRANNCAIVTRGTSMSPARARSELCNILPVALTLQSSVFLFQGHPTPPSRCTGCASAWATSSSTCAGVHTSRRREP